jgi:DNA polymerase III delta subunit
METGKQNVHLVIGDRDQRMQQVVKGLLGDSDDGVHLTRIDGQETALEDIATAFFSLPFMGSERRPVLVENLPPPTRSGPFWRWLAENLDRIPDSTEAVLTVSLDGMAGRERSGRIRTAQALESDRLKVHGLPALTGDLRSGQNARRWVADLARQGGVTLDPEAVELLLRQAELDGNVLAREVEKLSALVGFEGRVSASHVRSVDPLPAHVVVWEYIDAVVAADPSRAANLLAGLLEEGEAPEALIAMLAARVRQLITIRSLIAAGADYGAVAKRARTSPGMVRRAAPQAMGLGEADLRAMQAAIVDLDERSKNGRLTLGGLAAGLQTLTVRFCYRSFRN